MIIEFIDKFLGGDDTSMAKKKKRGPPHGSRKRASAKWSQEKRDTVAGRIQQRMVELGITTANELAEQSRISNGTLSKILNAQRQNVNQTTIESIAAALKSTVAYLTGDADYVPLRAAEVLFITKTAALGRYVMVSTQSADPLGTVEDSVPIDERYANAPRFGVQVEDDSLTGLDPPMSRGVVALVIDFVAAQADGAEIENGHIYLIERTNGSGHVETAFRKATVSRERYEFEPITNNRAFNKDPAHKVVIWRDRPDSAQEQRARVIGLYYSASSPKQLGPPRLLRNI